MRKTITALLAASALTLPADALAQKLGKAELAAIAASPEQIAATAKVMDGPLDLAARVETSPFYVQKLGLLRITQGDKYMRAFIDKKTGETRFQMVMWANHGLDWQFWDRGVAEGPSGPVALTGHRLNSDVSCSRYGCTKMESIALDVDEALLRWVASGARAGVDNRWNMKVNGRYVDGVPTAIQKTEAAGLLIAVDRLRQRYPARNMGSLNSEAGTTTASGPERQTSAGSSSSLPPGVKQLGPDIWLYPSPAESGYCVQAPVGYVGTGSESRPAITKAMPRCRSSRSTN